MWDGCGKEGGADSSYAEKQRERGRERERERERERREREEREREREKQIMKHMAVQESQCNLIDTTCHDWDYGGPFSLAGDTCVEEAKHADITKE